MYLVIFFLCIFCFKFNNFSFFIEYINIYFMGIVLRGVDNYFIINFGFFEI